VNPLMLGIFAFIVLTMFDYNKLKMLHPLLNGLFAVGVGLIIIATFMILSVDLPLFTFQATPLLWVVSGLGFIEMIYALFFALPFSKTYVKTSLNSEIITTGLYGLCRHPGVWGFFIFYLFAALASGNGSLLIAAVVWTLMDILHVWIQDSLFFVKTLKGYTLYKKTTPFLFFGIKELRKLIKPAEEKANEF
jgi:protein-S-isoprenylcysteine O-methyltransferase Ste14